MIGQDLHQEIPRGIHRDPDPSALQVLHDVHVHGLRHHGRNAAGQRQNIARFQAVQLPVQRVDVLLLDGRSHSVDLCLLIGAELHVDPGHALFHPDKVISHALFIQKALDLVSGKSRREAQGDVVKSQVLQDDGNVDSLSSREQELLRCPVDPSRAEMIHRRDVVQRRIEGYCVDHFCFPLSGRGDVLRSPAFTLSVFCP